MPTEISGSTGVNKIQDGTVVNADIVSLAASKLTGALPAISGASLTGITTGKILQVQYVVFSTTLTTSSDTFTAFNETLDITPSATSSKIYAFCNIHIYINNHAADSWSSGNIQLFRDSTRVANSDQGTPSNTYAFGRHTTSDTDRMMSYVSKNFQDSPSSTSTLTYSIKAHSKNSLSVYYNNFGASNMILMEVAG